MANYGLLSTGFSLKRLPVILEEINAELVGLFGEIDTSAESVFGQLNGVYSRHLTELWELAELIYQSQYPNSAFGTPLDSVCSITAIERLAATQSRVVTQVNGVEGTTFPIGSLVSQNVTSEQFTVDVDTVLSALTSHKVVVTIAAVVPETGYSFIIDDNTVAYTSGVSDDQADIVTALVTNTNNNPLINTKVIASATGVAGEILIRVIDYSDAENTFKFEEGVSIDSFLFWSPVPVTAVNTGKIVVPVNSISTFVTTVANIDEIFNGAEGVSGRDTETDDALRIRRRESLSIVSASTANAILSKIKQEIEEVTAAFIFENTSDIYEGDSEVFLTLSANFSSGNTVYLRINGQTTSIVTYATSHVATINALVSAILLLSNVKSAEVVAGSSDLTIRVVSNKYGSTLFRVEGVDLVIANGASQPTVTYEYANLGRPPHSFELVVAAVNTSEVNQSIADKLWEIKPAGIKPFGNTSKTVVDSNGDNQTVGFSHSIDKYVHVELTYYSTNSDSPFPSTGEQQIIDEILRLGSTLTFGSDLFVQVFQFAGYVAGGVTNVTVRLAVTDTAEETPSWSSNNIKLEPSELPIFNSSRITLIRG